MKATDQLTLNHAAEHVLGWKGRFRGKKLLRKVLAKEKRIGRELAIRDKSRNGRTGYFVTAGMLRDEFPELLIPTAEGVARDVKIRLDALMVDIEQMVHDSVAKHLNSCVLQNRDTKIELGRLREYTESNIRSISRQIEDMVKNANK